MQGPSSNLPPFAPGVFREGDAGSHAVLLGSRCDACNRCYFPHAALCPSCLEETRDAELGSRGRIYSYTIVRTKPPLGLPAPYAVGYVDLDECGLRVFALLDPRLAGRLRIGMPVCLAAAPLGHDGRGNACLRPYFAAAETEAAA